MTKKNGRLILVDEIRGLSIILMVIYHGVWDIWQYHIFGISNLDFFDGSIINFLRDFFAGVFILISGFCCNLSENNLIRGLKCFCVGLLLTAITYLIDPNFYIVWGILHMLGVCMMLYGLIEKLCKKTFLKKQLLTTNSFMLMREYNLFFMIILAVLFFLTFNLPNGYIGIFKLPSYWLSLIHSCKFLFPLGFCGYGFTSSDYFPLIPWGFLFAIGSFLGNIKSLYSYKFLYRSNFKFLSFCGRHTLIIYLLHQPILCGLFYVLDLYF